MARLKYGLGERFEDKYNSKDLGALEWTIGVEVLDSSI